MISTELFPYDKFGFRLEFGDGKNPTICWFECQEHLDKYLERYKLDKRTLKIVVGFDHSQQGIKQFKIRA